MCGLVAHFSYGAEAPPPSDANMLRMRDAMAPRGPDGTGSWRDGNVALGHRRLAIIDLTEDGAQPMLSADGRLAITFNGEIYNYRALRLELEGQGCVFRSHSDTEVLLHLYRRDGTDMFRHLRGMYAFALWDADARCLLLARDPFGIKPLYIADDGRSLRAASQVKALLAGGVAREPDPAGMAGFLLWGNLPEPFTLFRGIAALPAGSWLRIEEGGRRTEGRHFDMASEIAAAREAAWQPDAIRAALLDSVSLHREADVPVGLFLSAGLDSATLAALIAEAAGSGAGVKAVTLGFGEFEGSDKDEVPLARIIARSYGLSHDVRRITAQDFSDASARLLQDMDQPSIDGVNTWFVARAARQSGLKVAMSGVGGDELFGGYDNFRHVPRLAGLLRPARFVPGLGRGFRAVAAPLLAGRASPKWAGLLELGGDWPGAYLLRRGLFMPWELADILGPDLAREGWNRLEPMARLSAGVPQAASDRMKVSALETGWYLKNQLLRDSDWAGMAHGLEIRTPLVDIGLFRACLPALAGRRPPGKRDMAASARPALPDAVLERGKTGFFVPVSEWLGASSLRGWARQVLDAQLPDAARIRSAG
jgi:asparagine synthase (glutamine-hydrolysing)